MNSDETHNDELNSNFWEDVYANPDNLVEIEFANKTNQVKYVLIEPASISIELDLNTEYKIVTHEKTFAIEYNSEHQFTLYTERSFGFKLYKRPNRKINDSFDWELDIDWSDMNL